MSVAVPHNQEFTLAWTPLATHDTMKRAAITTTTSTTTSALSSTVKKDCKKRTRALVDDPSTTPVKQETSKKDASGHGSDTSSDANENPTTAVLSTDDQDAAEEYKWPSLTRKRQRMTEDERKARHREVQRQFMQRKLAKLDEMRKFVTVLERQYMLLQLSQDRARLEHENGYLHHRVLAMPPHWTHEHPQDELHRKQHQALHVSSLPAQPVPHRASHPAPHHHQSANQSHRAHTGMLPWDEILEAVSEANV